MQYRKLGKTGLMVSEVGFGGEWLERHDVEHSVDLIRYAHEKGINIIDCWMADPKSRDIIGKAIAPCRDEWFVQCHIGATWQNGQYVRTRDMKYVKPASAARFAITGLCVDSPMWRMIPASCSPWT